MRGCLTKSNGQEDKYRSGTYDIKINDDILLTQNDWYPDTVA